MNRFDVSLEIGLNLLVEITIVYLLAQYNLYIAAAVGLKIAHEYFSHYRRHQLMEEAMEWLDEEETEEENLKKPE
jgi:predicted 2-oxoglutarate/Fe(II)-dependent dioxygenase YbiX